MSTEETQGQPEQSSVPTEDEAGNSYPPAIGPDPLLTPAAIKAEAAGPEELDEEGKPKPKSRLAVDVPREGGNDHQTVEEVLADVDAGKVSAQQALDKERAGQNRTTLVSGLQQRGAS